MQILYIGVDVSAKQLDICSSDDKQVTQIANTLSAIEQWLGLLPLETIIAMEVTSHNHLVLAEATYRSGRQVYVLNPMQVKHYAQGVGRRTKNDRIDARLICRYIQREQHELRAWQPMTQSQATINTLFNRRGTLVNLRSV
ncbi:MAG: transposase [Gammaproteobacteria bacterium]|nr:transposase [Gammaproteobacteria bacterium]